MKHIDLVIGVGLTVVIFYMVFLFKTEHSHVPAVTGETAAIAEEETTETDTEETTEEGQTEEGQNEEAEEPEAEETPASESMRTYFFEITNDLTGKTARVLLDGEEDDKSEALKIFRTRRYAKYNGYLGKGDEWTWEFLDSEGNDLFTIRELKSRNVISIEIGGTEATYQYEDI